MLNKLVGNFQFQLLMFPSEFLLNIVHFRYQIINCINFLIPCQFQCIWVLLLLYCPSSLDLSVQTLVKHWAWSNIAGSMLMVRCEAVQVNFISSLFELFCLMPTQHHWSCPWYMRGSVRARAFSACTQQHLAVVAGCMANKEAVLFTCCRFFQTTGRQREA